MPSYVIFVVSQSVLVVFFFFSSRRRHTRSLCDWSSDVCSSDLLFLSCECGDSSDLRTTQGERPGTPSNERTCFARIGRPMADIRWHCSWVIEIGRASCRERV